jgi:uncharacterized repeat protein (TIGR01451 family)
MSKVKVLFAAFSASVVTAALVAIPALACHPQGVIVKYVQNQTTGSAKSDANDATHAVAAKPGDVLKYTIEVRNNAAKGNGADDMANTVMTDTLPAGVELVSNASTRTITVNLGTVKSGQSVVKEYLVKVTAATDGVVTNKACFTGEATNKDSKQAQKGCDVATVKVTVPETPVQPQQPETPVTPTPTAKTVSTVPTELPNTGSAAFAGALTGAGSLGVAGYNYLRSKRNLRSAHNC